MLLEGLEDHHIENNNIDHVPLDDNLNRSFCLICNKKIGWNDQIRSVIKSEEKEYRSDSPSDLEKLYGLFCEYMNFNCFTPLSIDNINFDFTREFFPFCKNCKSSLDNLEKYHNDLIELEYKVTKLVGGLTLKILETWTQNEKEDVKSMNIMNQNVTDSQDLQLETLNVESSQELIESSTNNFQDPSQIVMVVHGDNIQDEAQRKVSAIRELIFNCFNAKVLVTKLTQDENPSQRKRLRLRGRPKRARQVDLNQIRPKAVLKNYKENESIDINTQINDDSYSQITTTQTLPVQQDDENIVEESADEFWESDMLSNFEEDENIDDDDDYEVEEEEVLMDEEWLPQNTEVHKKRRPIRKKSSSYRTIINKKPKVKSKVKQDSPILSNNEQEFDSLDKVEEGDSENKGREKSKRLKRRRTFKKSKNNLKRPKLGNNTNERTFQRVVEVSPNKFLYRNEFYYEKLPDESKFKCCLCGIVTDHKKAMLDHLRRRRVTTCDKKKAPKSFICDVCGKFFSRKDHFKEHLLTHLDVRSFLCSECGKTYKTKSRLQVHSLTHRGEEAKKYQCQSCGKKFLKNSFLKTHALSHTGEKLSECPECHKKFSRRCHMMRHMKSVHVEVKPYGCPIPNCGKRYTQNHTLRRHLLVAHYTDGRKEEMTVVSPDKWQQIPIEVEQVIAQVPSSFLPVSATTTLSPDSTLDNTESTPRAGTSHFIFLPQSNFKLAND